MSSPMWSIQEYPNLLSVLNQALYAVWVFFVFFSLGFLAWLSVPVQLIDWRMIYDHVNGDVKPYSLTDSHSADVQMNIYTVRQPTTVN